MLTNKLKNYLELYHNAATPEQRSVMAHQLVPIAEVLIENIEDELETEYMLGFGDGFDEGVNAVDDEVFDNPEEVTVHEAYQNGISVGANLAAIIYEGIDLLEALRRG